MKPKKWTRRAFVSLLLGSIHFAPFAADARIHGGIASGGGGGGGLVTTMTLLNTSGSTQAIGSCTQIFGHPFKKGDMPSGQYPIFKTTGGTVIPYSISTKTKAWSDGSMKHASFMLRLPVTIASSPGSLTVNIYSGGTAPSASSRATSDFTAGGLDLNVFVTGQDQLSGDWTSNLSQGITAAFSDNYVFMDGDAGKVWRIRANFRQSGADHGQLEGWWFVQALNNSSGTLGGIRHLTRVIQPIYNETSPAPQYRSFSAFKTRNSTSTLVDFMPTLPAPHTFTYSGGATINGDFFAMALNCTTAGMESCIGAKLTTNGTLPTGLDTTTFYASVIINGSYAAIGTNFNGAAHDGAGACITPSANGTGTHTMTFYPMVSAYGSLYTATAEGRYNYVQGAGSLVSDSTIVCQMDAAYWCRTKCLPPFAIGTYSVASNASFTYFPGTNGPVGRNVSATGEREDVGPINSWYARHIFTQAPVDDRAVRVIGLVGGHLPVALYDKTTRSILPGNNGPLAGGSYSGMPTPNQGFRWTGTDLNNNGLTIPSNTNILSQGWTGVETSHLPGLAYYAYLLTGEPQFKDNLAEYSNNGLNCQYPNTGVAVVDATHNSIGGIRNATISGTTYRGVFSGESGTRTMTWACRDIGVAGIANFENATWNTYFTDVLTDITNGLAAYRAMLVAGADPYVTNNGIWDEGAGNAGGMWGTGYQIGAFTMIAGINESAGALAHANYLVKWPTRVALTFSSYLVGCYRQTIRKGDNPDSLYSTNDSQIAFWSWNVTWDSATQLFTLGGPVPSGDTFGNDHVFVWNPGEGGTPPAGMNAHQGYYVINKSGSGVGSTFQLSTSQGGAAITLTDTNSFGSGVMGRPTTAQCSSSGALDNTTASGYHCNVTAVSQWLNAIGGTVDSGYLTNMFTRIQTFPSYAANFNVDPKYAMQSTYA